MRACVFTCTLYAQILLRDILHILNFFHENYTHFIWHVCFTDLAQLLTYGRVVTAMHKETRMTRETEFDCNIHAKTIEVLR